MIWSDFLDTIFADQTEYAYIPVFDKPAHEVVKCI